MQQRKVTCCNNKKMILQQHKQKGKFKMRRQIKKRVMKQRKLLVAIAKQHYCNIKNKKCNLRCNVRENTNVTKKCCLLK